MDRQFDESWLISRSFYAGLHLSGRTVPEVRQILTVASASSRKVPGGLSTASVAPQL